jgi:antitoxin component HigA of HigAB toxin-antitoxin module
MMDAYGMSQAALSSFVASVTQIAGSLINRRSMCLHIIPFREKS